MSVMAYSEIVSPFIQTKALCHIGKLRELQNNSIIAPVTCELDLTDGFCNNKCRHCFFSTDKKSEPVIMPSNHAISLIDELCEIGVKAIEFTGGGEPLTHPDCEKILTHATKKGLSVGIVTNGLLLPRISNIISGLSFVRISLDAGTTTTYKEVHGVDVFEEVIDNIKSITRLNGDKVGIGYLILPNNIGDITVAAKVSREIGARFIQYRPASLPYDVEEHVWIKAQENVDKAKSNRSDTFQVFDAGIKWRHVIEKRQYLRCNTSSIVGVIKANGDIPICVLKRNEKDSIIGNFILENGFNKVWNSEKHKDMIAAIDLETCRKPCKHDSYNIMYEAVKNDYLHCDFI